MCTYNGSRFLQEQLDSIAAQTRQPDEMIVCDDKSEDDTVVILNSFAEKVPFSVHIQINPTNLGSTKNFENAIRMCTGDITFLADQDDIWYPEKTERIETILSSRTEIGAVFTDAQVIDEFSNPVGYRLWESTGFNSSCQEFIKKNRYFKILLKTSVVTGAAMAFRSIYRDFILPIPKNWVHDGWIALLVSAAAELVFLKDPLIKYRQHEDNQIGAGRKTLRDYLWKAEKLDRSIFLKEAEQFNPLLERLKSIGNREEETGLVLEKIRHLQIRGNLPDKRLQRFFAVLREFVTCGYFQYSNGIKSAVLDLLL